MFNEKAKMILGPPGTGKTTRLIQIVEELISKAVLPQQIGFVSFTKKAANEARTRAMSKFGLKADALPYFSTLHSLAFRFMNLEPRVVMGWGNYIDICKMLGLTITSQKITEEGQFNTVHTKGDRLFFMENFARSSKISLQQVHRKFVDDDIDFRELELLTSTLKRYKEVQNKMDFTDMIVTFNQLGNTPFLKALIVDEAQDLSPIQWDMVKILSKETAKIFIAGDDDQAIYTWAGADVKHFINLVVAETEVLHQSYRIPSKIHKMAEEVIKRVGKRNIKPYKPTSDEGKIIRHTDCYSMDMSKGSWLLLSRNIFLLPEYTKFCVEKGYLFEARYGSPVAPETGVAIRYWELLRTGEKIPASMAKLIYNYLAVQTRVKWGCKKLLDLLPDDELVDIMQLRDQYGLRTIDAWYKAFNKLPQSEVQYFRAALGSGERLDSEPRIKVNTIHGVKGGEADNVVLMLDMSARSFEEMQKNPDDEIRVWYVGITRTKKTLHIIHPRTQYFFDL